MCLWSVICAHACTCVLLLCVCVSVCAGDSNSVSSMHYLITWLSRAAGRPCPRWPLRSSWGGRQRAKLRAALPLHGNCRTPRGPAARLAVPIRLQLQPWGTDTEGSSTAKQMRSPPTADHVYLNLTWVHIQLVNLAWLYLSWFCLQRVSQPNLLCKHIMFWLTLTRAVHATKVVPKESCIWTWVLSSCWWSCLNPVQTILPQQINSGTSLRDSIQNIIVLLDVIKYKYICNLAAMQIYCSLPKISAEAAQGWCWMFCWHKKTQICPKNSSGGNWENIYFL